MDSGNAKESSTGHVHSSLAPSQTSAAVLHQATWACMYASVIFLEFLETLVMSFKGMGLAILTPVAGWELLTPSLEHSPEARPWWAHGLRSELILSGCSG